MTGFGPEGFAEFFQAVHGVPPFPWQQHLAEKVLKDGRWPSVIDLPTAAGKTAVIDIAVFHLASEADRGERRRAPMRIVFVVDRRIVVDATFDRARKIEDSLRMARSGILGKVKDNLRLLAGPDAAPLNSVRLRGGVPLERDWARSTAQPLVVVSTVDQAGSRLLFRGYGVSPGMLPVHAGLLGSDSLWLLDEVHLSRPLEETLRTISEAHVQHSICEEGRLAPFSVVSLSATPRGNRPDDAFPEQGFDIRSNAPEVFLKRLIARKPTELVSVKGDYIGEFVSHALRLAGLEEPGSDAQPTHHGRRRLTPATKDAPLRAAPPVQRVAVVVNHVNLARRIFRSLQDKAGERAQVALLTGRIRPFDRTRVLSLIKPLFAGEQRAWLEKPLLVVATQTIEAGADLDVDALVTEIAPLDSLRQRFGRLDRLGLRGMSLGVIISPSGHPPKGDGNSEDPWVPIVRVYGDAPWRTREWLATLKPSLDLGVDAFQNHLDDLTARDPSGLPELLTFPSHAPVLLPPYPDLWAMTRPVPIATPEPSLFLHGPRSSPEIQIVWRADIDLTDADASILSLELCPPSSLEAISVPIWAAKRWLEKKDQEWGIADVPEPDGPMTADAESPQPPRLLRWRERKWGLAPVDELTPGDMVVVPSSFGGCDAWGWDPESSVEVPDLGTEAHYLQRNRGAIRFTSATLRNALARETGTEITGRSEKLWAAISLHVETLGEELEPAALCRYLKDMEGLPETWRKLLAAMMENDPDCQFYVEDEPGRGFVLSSGEPLGPGLLTGESEGSDEGYESTTGQEEDSSFIGAEVTLADHHHHVADRALNSAHRSGLSDRMAHLLELAGGLHDLGKADPRFQADLRGLSELIVRDPELATVLLRMGTPIAKSATRRGSAPGRSQSRGLRAIPNGFRHEALSVALAEKHPEVVRLPEQDRDLVLWLIGTHHGYGRPFFPSCEDPLPQMEVSVDGSGWSVAVHCGDAPLRLDQGWVERCQRLNRRYGPWELARLEAILRLADHAASASERSGGA